MIHGREPKYYRKRQANRSSKHPPGSRSSLWSRSCVRQLCPAPWRQTIRNKQSRLVIHPRHTTPFLRHINKRKEEKAINENHTGSKAQKKRQGKTTFESAAPVGGASSIGMLLPSRPGALLPCLPSPSYFRPPRFPFYSSCFPPSPHSLGRVSFHSCCCLPSPHSLGHHPRRVRGAVYSAVPHPRATAP